MMEKLGDKKFIVVAVVAVLLVLAVGFTFAYFVTGTNISGSGSNVGGDTAELIKVKYDAGSSAFAFDNAYPGVGSAAKSFSVTISPTTSEKSATYMLKLNIETNTFEKCTDTNYDALTNACTKDAEELVYTIKDTSSGSVLATGDINGVVGDVELLKETKTVDAETTFNYSFEVAFKDTNADQNHNLNKSLVGSIKVVFAE